MANEEKDLPQEILERFDKICAKLGVAANKVWKFTVDANVVNASRDLAKAILLVLTAIALLSWSYHVGHMSIPKDTVSTVTIGIESNTTRRTVEEISETGWVYIATGIVTGLAGTIMVLVSVCSAIDATARAATAEADAFQSLMKQIRR